MTDIQLTASILALKRTPAEKILLAYLCQRAALSNGQCTDSNRELAGGTAIHVQTVSDLINRLSQTSLLEARIDAAQANQRTLRPAQELVVYYKSTDYSNQQDYKPTDYSSQTGYKSTDYSAGKETDSLTRPHRLCPVTGVDITHQPLDHRVVTKATLHALFLNDRLRFDSLVAQLLTPEQAQLPMGGRCIQINLNARKLAKIQLVDDEPDNRTVQLNERFCPITGVDIGRQRTDARQVSSQTLRRLAYQNTAAYLALAAWLIPEQTPDLAYPGRDCRLMASVVRELAASGLSIPPISLPLRCCPVTGIDLSQQSPDYPLVTASTLKKMFIQDRTQFDAVATRFLTPDELTESMSGQCRMLMIRVRQKAVQLTNNPSHHA